MTAAMNGLRERNAKDLLSRGAFFQLSHSLALAVFALLFVHTGAALAESKICEKPEMRTGERPSQQEGPTEISASFIIVDVLAVNDVDQKIELDLIATFEWQDTRLTGLQGCQFGVTDVWFPRLSLLDSSALDIERKGIQNRVQIGAGGTVFYRQRYSGTISTYHNLRQFPFDNHVFDIGIVTLGEDTNSIRFIANNDQTTISDKLNVEGWSIQGVELFTENRFLPQVGLDLSVLTLRIKAVRDGDFYIYRVLLPLFLVVAMSWAVFWVPPERFEFQIGLGATSMLTTIAFNLTIGNNLPALGYLTTLDAMIIWAILLVFLSIAEALCAGLWQLRGKSEQARLLDLTSRFAFPLSLIFGWLFLVKFW